ncbi:DUF7064 domain-containing protein [Sphingomonas sp. ID0503]|uniref:DUF7064 domain-containing protein n=1 Tax=Sphingomonas sp. ID0503 TaxID=3399691 RepID=UPI003AFB5EF2
MIQADVFSFHARDPADWTWTETVFLFFSVPEEGISCSIYVLARPNLGVCHSSIEIHKGFCHHPWEGGFTDAQLHLPCPADFSNFTLPNGLSFQSRNQPRDFAIQYLSKDGACRFDVDYVALSYPFDTHDPNDNPLVAHSKESANVPGYDGWHNGHMESIGRITGKVTLYGKTYEVDCIDGMDKSWGPRPDFGQQGSSWFHVATDDGFAAFLAMGLNFVDREVTYGPLRFGFVVVDGEKTGIVEASMSSQRSDMLVMRTVVDFKDAKGRTYHAVGTALAAAPWYTFNPACVSFQTLLRWECNGKTGASHFTDFMGLNFMTQGVAPRHVP